MTSSERRTLKLYGPDLMAPAAIHLYRELSILFIAWNDHVPISLTSLRTCSRIEALDLLFFLPQSEYRLCWLLLSTSTECERLRNRSVSEDAHHLPQK